MAEVLLSKRNTLVLKGVGILLMLFHHLFYSKWAQPLYDDLTINGVGLVNQLGIFSKLCVAVFVFTSGFGLMVSTPKDIKIKDFYWKRFKKLYLNYWFVWLLFVPVGVFIFGRTFTEAYGDHAALKAVLDFFGILKMFGFESYNPTWWFYNCIILLYLLYPLLNKYLWRIPFIVICICLTANILFIVPGINVIANYLIVFVVGMLMARMPLTWIEKTKTWQIVFALATLSIWHFTKSASIPVADAFICVGLSLLLFKMSLWKWLRSLLEELGRHSMNMFLTHTFFFYFWFKDYIYITRNPLLIFLSLVVVSYLTSVVIELIKKTLGFYKLLEA